MDKSIKILYTLFSETLHSACPMGLHHLLNKVNGAIFYINNYSKIIAKIIITNSMKIKKSFLLI